MGMPQEPSDREREAALDDVDADELHSGRGISPSSLLSVVDAAGLQARCVQALQERALLVDAVRLAEQTAARLLRQGGAFETARVEAAIDEALREIDARDREAERRGDLPVDALEGDHAFLVAAFGIRPLFARAAAIEFNALDLDTRRAFFSYVLEGKALGDQKGRGRGGSATISAMVRRALGALFLQHSDRGGSRP